MRSACASPPGGLAATSAALCGVLLGLLVLVAAPAAHAGAYDDFSLGTNAEHQVCRGVWRFESAKAPTAVDVYCGAWEAPSGTVRLAAPGADPVLS